VTKDQKVGFSGREVIGHLAKRICYEMEMVKVSLTCITKGVRAKGMEATLHVSKLADTK
jgi:hypothetical protein